MPLYEYQCEACGERFEAIQKFSDARLDSCRKCGKGPVQRLLSSPAIQFKGSGWYITDYAKKSNADAGSAKTDSKTDAKTEAKTGSTAGSKAETKSETKSEPPAKTTP